MKTRRRRIGLALVGLLVALLGWGLFAPSSAQAACPIGVSNGTDEPIPSGPSEGIMGWIEQPPNPMPPDADPFAKGSNTTIQEQYGYAGLRWNTFDLGCGGDLADPIAAGLNSMANVAMMTPVVLSALTGALLRWAFVPDFLKGFDPLVENTVAGLRDSIFLMWLPIPAVVLGSILLFKAHVNKVSDTIAAIGGAVGVLFVAALIFNAPLAAGHMADQAVTSTNSALIGGLNLKVNPSKQEIRGTASEMESNLHSSVLYQAWLTGELGRGHDSIADKYGPDLFKAQAMTWREKAAYDADPTGKGADIITEKQSLWDDTTQKIKDEDPGAYENLTGHHAENRLFSAWIAFAGVMCAVPFLMLAAILVLLALMIVRFGVMFFPVVALMGMLPSTRHILEGLFRTMFAACVNCVVFTFGAGLLVKGFSFIMAPSSGINPLLQIVLMAIVSVIFWVVLKPFRKLTQQVGRRNHFGEAAGGVSTEAHRAGRFAYGIAKTAGTYALGFKIGKKLSEGDDDEGDDRSPAPYSEAYETTRSQTYTVNTPDSSERQALPSPVYEADDVRNPAQEASERGLPAERYVPEQRGPSSAREAERDASGQEFYNIVSDDSIPVYKGTSGTGNHYDPSVPSGAPALPSGGGE